MKYLFYNVLYLPVTINSKVMKNAPKFIFLLLIITLSLGCKKKTVHLNEEFNLNFNKTAIVKTDDQKIEITFNKLVDESRCPPNTHCVWQGEVAVRIQVDGDTEYILGFHSAYPSSIVYKDRTIKLVEVNYKNPESYGKENNYSIRLKVE